MGTSSGATAHLKAGLGSVDAAALQDAAHAALAHGIDVTALVGAAVIAAGATAAAILARGHRPNHVCTQAAAAQPAGA